MADKKSEDGCATVVGGAVIGIIVLISMIPKAVWIALGIVAAVGLVGWLVYKAIEAFSQYLDAADERDRAAQAAQVAANKKQRENAAHKAKQHLIEAIGEKNALLVASARTAVHKVAASEAAREGWLGDIDFSADINGITENFRKAHALRKVADELSALSKPSADDRKILGEAKATAKSLEQSATDRVKLIGRCATEAKLVDESLQLEREEARTAEQRAELHSQLSAMLYGIEAAPADSPADSTAAAVMARVHAYREVKNQMGAMNE